MDNLQPLSIPAPSSSFTKTGFIGLGHLGRAMAGRLASQGVDLILWNQTPQKAAALDRELGLPVAESPAALEKLYFSVPYRTQKEVFRISYLELQDLFVMNPKI